MAVKESALARKHVATPSVAITTAARAGPTMRAVWTRTEFSETALSTWSRSTISLTKLWRVGLSTAVTIPRAKIRAKTTHTWTSPKAVSAQSTSAGTAMSACVTTSSRRFGRRSASRPPQAPATRTGANCRAVETPSATPEPVRRRTSHVSATVCIHVPASEIAWPVK